MRVALKCHPATPCDAVTRIDVEVERAGLTHVTLRYTAAGATAGLLLPQPSQPQRSDGLWHHTCFEAFVQSVGAKAYAEFNFAPSLAWAAYRFDDHRAGMREADDVDALSIQVDADGERCMLTAALELPGDAPWNLGLSAVIEETSGRKSYWALAHPDGRPDFHRADCFTLKLV